MFRWWRDWRRGRVEKKPVPAEWIGWLEDYVPFFADLKPEARGKFLGMLNVFIREKHFIPAGGMALTDEVKVVISADAVRLILGLDISYYDRLTEIVVYPGTYYRPARDPGNPDEVWGAMDGEAHDWGVVVLSWEAVRSGVTAIHEFAHVLDRADGGFDGTPALRDPSLYPRWAKVMEKHFRKLRERDEKETAVLDEYGAHSEAEFFAIATEAFFEWPLDLKEALPDLYRELKRFYNQDPAAIEAAGAGRRR